MNPWQLSKCKMSSCHFLVYHDIMSPFTSFFSPRFALSLIRIFLPKKDSLLHKQEVFCWFPWASSVKIRIFKCSRCEKCFVGGAPLFTGGLPCEGLLRSGFTYASPMYHPPFMCLSRIVTRLRPDVNGWNSKPSHQKPLKISRERPFCEGLDTLFGNLKTYMFVRAKTLIDIEGEHSA